MGKKKKTTDAYARFRLVLAILFAAYIIFTIIMVMTVSNRQLCMIILGIVGLILFFGSLVTSLIFVAGESDKNSIRIIELNFSRVDEGMNKLKDLYPFIFDRGNYINTYIFNTNDSHFYELYTKDDIKWMRDIGTRNPKERYYYGT